MITVNVQYGSPSMRWQFKNGHAWQCAVVWHHPPRRYRQPVAPGKTRRRIEKARKVNETRRKATALGAEEQAADMVDTEKEDGDETEGEGSAVRGARRGKRGTRQQVIDDSRLGIRLGRGDSEPEGGATH